LKIRIGVTTQNPFFCFDVYIPYVDNIDYERNNNENYLDKQNNAIL
jgi:hypothetical protein